MLGCSWPSPAISSHVFLLGLNGWFAESVAVCMMDRLHLLVTLH